MAILAGGKRAGERIVTSVKFTEEWGQRLKGNLGTDPGSPSYRLPGPIRGILLQDVYNNQSGLMQIVGRDGVTFGFMIEILGINQFPQTNNKFRLRLKGISDTPSGTTVIGESVPISMLNTSATIQAGILSLSRLLSPENVIISLGNPVYDNDLQLYSPVVPPQLVTDIAASYVGSWYVEFQADVFPFDDLLLEVFFDQTATTTGLTNMRVYKTLDTVTAETEIVTDCHNRSSAYPWQAGTMVMCLNFPDIGYGILNGTSRTFNTPTIGGSL